MHSMAHDRPALNVYVSEEAAAAWRAFAAHHGVTIAAICEVLGHRMGAIAERAPGRMPPFWRQVVADARVVAAERRARGRRM